MNTEESVKDWFRNSEGVLDILDLSREEFMKLWSVEKTIKTQSLHEYENIGFEELARRKCVFCFFCNDRFRLEKESVLKMVCDGNTVLGTTVLRGEMEEYRKRDDVIWISEDFVMFLNVQGKGQERFVLYPYEFPEMTEAIPGCLDMIGASPAPSTDACLKEMAGIPLSERVFTFLIGFNERCQQE